MELWNRELFISKKQFLAEDIPELWDNEVINEKLIYISWNEKLRLSDGWNIVIRVNPDPWYIPYGKTGKYHFFNNCLN
jgi:hypothetical protein